MEMAFKPMAVLSVNQELRTYISEKKNYFFAKRLFDIAFSLLFLMTIMIWLFPIVALLIKLDSRGPVLFRQKRMGSRFQKFTCFKFRTMFVNEDADFHQAIVNDCRITSIGNFLRKTNIDEFPQFVNVLMGDMSVVGPRPHMILDWQIYSRLQQDYA